MSVDTRDRDALERVLLSNLRAQREDLRALLERASTHWGYEDPVYRFYHQSFKVFGLQETTSAIVQRLRALAPDCQLNSWFLAIVSDGTGHVFAQSDNTEWLRVARPVVEAFFHARFFLDMAVRYSDLESSPSPLPSGYAALLYLYQLR
jgi:hypothetical protein